MKKTYKICSVLLATIVLCGILYVGIGSNRIENKAWDYLKENNYSVTDIKSLEVKHSFVNILLSYNEWIVDVVFEDEPDSVYKYTLRDGGIVQSGVLGTTDKEALKHWK